MTEIASLEAAADRLVSLPAAEGHEVRVLEAVAVAFAAMRGAAADAGVHIVPVSGFRSIERQTEIWNRKIRAALADGLDIDAAVAKTMEYSAPPGWSRHHLGTDLDLVGGALLREPRLEPEDWTPQGVCADAAAWLDEFAADYAFFRPYRVRRRGFAAEPWHWSHATLGPVAATRLIDFDWSSWLATAPFLGASVLLPSLAARIEDHLVDIDVRCQSLFVGHSRDVRCQTSFVGHSRRPN